MSQEHSSATEAAHRLGNRDWMQPAQQRRKKWGRKRTVIAIVGGVLIVSGAFVIADGPRQTGITEAMELTCGEYVHPGVLEPDGQDQPWRGTGHPQEFFEPWEDHRQHLVANAADDDEYSAETVTAFIDEVEMLAEENGAQPVFGAFMGWNPSQGGFSATAGDTSVILGEHIETPSSSDRVSLIDPDTGEVTVTAALEHPDREQWEDPERVLYGVGETDGELVLQTPTVRGNTDVVIVGPDAEADPECIRLEGGFAPNRYEEDFPSAWRSVMDLQQVKDSEEDSFLVVHGRDMDTAGSPHQISSVNVEAGEPELHSGQLEWEEEPDTELAGFDVSAFEELSDGHYFLDWGYGYIILGPTS